MSNTQTPGKASLHARHVPKPAMIPTKGMTVKEINEKLSKRRPDSSRLFKPGSVQRLASNTVQGPASIAELARSLKNDPDLIFEWVYNNIEYTPTFGEQKGAWGCLIDGIGNDFDQSSLLFALLTAAGYSPSYVLGNVQLSATQAAGWLGTDPTDLSTSFNMLWNGGYPVAYENNLGYDTVYFTRLWVQLTLGGTTYYFDPAYKSYTSTTGINLVTASGYSQTTLAAQAAVGATIDPGDVYLQNMNQANVRSQLSSYSNALVSYIKTNNPTATLDDVIGGRKIIPLAGPVRITSLPYQDPFETPVVWAAMDDGYRCYVDVVCADINVQFYGSDVHEQRLCIFMDSSTLPVLTLNGAVVANGSWVPTEFNYEIDHPYLNFNLNQNLSEQCFSWRSFLIGVTLGPTGRGVVDFYNDQFAANTMAGGSTDSEPILGAQLASSFYSYIAQVNAAYDIGGRIGDCGVLVHHTAGCAVWDTFSAPSGQGRALFDVGGMTAFVSGFHASANTQAVASAIGQNGHVLEQSGLAQTYEVGAVGPTKIVDYANQIGLEILKITPANQSTTLPLLSGYNSNELGVVNDALTNGLSCYLPQSAPEMIGSASCVGLISVTTWGAIFGWLGTSKGGGTHEYADKKKPEKKDKDKDDGEVPDPIILRTGDYVYEQSDLTIGSSIFPYALEFKSMYGGRNFNQVDVLGRGWDHNWNIRAKIGSDGFRALGSDSPLEAAASIVEMLVLQDLYSDFTYLLKKIVLGAMCAQWWADSLSSNSVTVSLPEGGLVFTLLQDGTYNPPLNCADALTVSSGLYTHTTPQQVKRNFDASGNLSTMVFPYGVTITLGYSSGLLTSISNGLGRQLTLAYTSGFLSSVSDGTGRSVSYAVNATTKQLDSITDPLSHATTFSYDGAGRFLSYFRPQNPTTAVIINSYDSLNRVSTQTDVNGNVRTYYFAGSRSEVIDPALHGRVTYFGEHGQILKEIDELGFVTQYQYDGLRRLTRKTLPEGNYTSWTYDSRNNVLAETRVAKSGSGLANTVKTWTYDATYNKKHTLLDARSNTWTWNYDVATGNLLSFVKPIVGGLTPQESWTYNARGQVLTYTDETSVVTKFTYDVTTEKLLSTVLDFGTSPHLNLTTSLGYDSVGNVNSVTDANLNQTTYVFDNKRRLTQRTDPVPFSYVTIYGFDFNDNMTSVQRQVTSAPTYQTYTYQFTLSDKPFTLTDPASNVTTKTYDVLDRLSTVKDAENRLTTYSYDARSKLSGIIDATGVVSQTSLYSNNGLLASIKDPNGNVTSYSRDGFDRLDKTTYADSSFEENQVYDANDNVLTYRTRSGNTIVCTFDVLNRLSTKTPTGQAVVTFGYDLHNRLLSQSTPVVAGNPASGNFQFGYDTAGRLKQETTPDSKLTQYQRDSNGNLTVLTYPDGYFVTRLYDQLNRLTDVKLNGAGTAALHYNYDQLSRRSSLSYGNGATSTYTFQLNDDLTAIAAAFVGSSVTLSYGFNKVHQETSRTASDGSYVWHPAIAGSVSYSANNVNKYPTVGGISYAYDGNANLTGDGTWTYTYDTENHLLTANKTGVSASYVYDPAHRQIQKTVSTTKTRYVYAGWQRIADYDGTANTLLNRYVYGIEFDEALIQVSSAGVLTYLHSDRLGSIIATSDSSGAVVNKSKYSPFGENAPVGTTFGFSGQRYDAETGLHYYKRRHLSPTLGRFLQPDPIGYLGDLNLYGYVRNNPLNLTDSMGLKTDNEHKPNTHWTDDQGQEHWTDGKGNDHWTDSEGYEHYREPADGNEAIKDPKTGNIEIHTPDGWTIFEFPDGKGGYTEVIIGPNSPPAQA